MNDTYIIMQRLDALQNAVQLLTKTLGSRLTREQLCARRSVHRNTLADLIARGVVPRPDVNGRFLLDEVLAYEQREREQKTAVV